MTAANTERQWGAVQQTLHWLVALAVLSQLSVGFVFALHEPEDALWQSLFPVHATLGLTILLLMLLRLAWRVANPVPPLPDTLPSWQKRLARANHWLFYILLIGMPVGGYLLVNAHGEPVPFFGMALPRLVAENETMQTLAGTMHATGAFVAIALVLLHVTGALRHEIVLKDNVLRRMTPLRPRRESGS